MAIREGAALRLKNANEVVARAALLLANSQIRGEMASAGRDFSARYQGATDKMFAIAAGLLETRSPSKARRI